jgi:hypothetical protein
MGKEDNLFYPSLAFSTGQISYIRGECPTRQLAAAQGTTINLFLHPWLVSHQPRMQHSGLLFLHP